MIESHVVLHFDFSSSNSMSMRFCPSHATSKLEVSLVGMAKEVQALTVFLG